MLVKSSVTSEIFNDRVLAAMFGNRGNFDASYFATFEHEAKNVCGRQFWDFYPSCSQVGEYASTTSGDVNFHKLPNGSFYLGRRYVNSDALSVEQGF